MILAPTPDGVLAIRQSAHAGVAFQLAAHWGNRTTPRPAPRAEVLAAVLLHDAGWDDEELPLRLAADGAPEAFDTVPADRHAEIWRRSAARALAVGRYTGHLVMHHVTMLAGMSGDPARTLPDLVAARDALGDALASAPATRDLFRTGADEVNRAILRISDALAVQLCRGGRDAFTLANAPGRRNPRDLTLAAVGTACFRVDPWPFTGRRLTVRAEARRLSPGRFADPAALMRAWDAAGIERLSWTLLPAGAPADP